MNFKEATFSFKTHTFNCIVLILVGICIICYFWAAFATAGNTDVIPDTKKCRIFFMA